MQRNCGGVNTDGHGTNALKCVGKFVREPNRTKRRGVKYAASPQGFPLSGGIYFLQLSRGFLCRCAKS